MFAARTTGERKQTVTKRGRAAPAIQVIDWWASAVYAEGGEVG